MGRKLTAIEKAKRRLMRSNIPFDVRTIFTEGKEFSYSCLTMTYDSGRTPHDEREMVHRACAALHTLSGIKMEFGGNHTTFFVWDAVELDNAKSINAAYQDRREAFWSIHHDIFSGCTADYAEERIEEFSSRYAFITDGWTQKDADALRRLASENCK